MKYENYNIEIWSFSIIGKEWWEIYYLLTQH